MVLHPEACWGGLPTRVQKTKIYNLETGEYITNTGHFQKKAFGGSYLAPHFGRETIWREHYKKTFGGKISKKLLTGKYRKSNSGGRILVGTLQK